MNRLAVLLATPAVTLEDGSFDAHVDDEPWTLGPGTLFVTRPGMAFRCRHGDDLPPD